MEVHSLISALHAKYADNEPLHCQIYVPKSAPGKTESGAIRVPQQLVLQCFSISQAGDPDQIAALCGRVQELDLSHNQLSDWNQVLVMVQQMPCLRVLNLSQNPFAGSTLEDQVQQFPNISVLALNDTQLSWPTLNQLLTVFPSLTELHISCNGYQEVGLPPEACHPSMRVLHFNSNLVTEFSQVCRLGTAFPGLDTLIMVETDIRSLGPADQLAPAFPQLRCLNISQGSLATWGELEKLNQLPCLTDIRLQKLPLLEDLEERERRGLVLAYLPCVRRLNGSVVEEVEHEDAERAFIRRYMDAPDKPNRYQELEAQYGRLDPLAQVDLTPKDHVKVKVEFQGREETMFINVRQSVAQLKKSLQNVAKIPASRMKLYHLNHFCACGADECRYPKKMLYSMNITDGDTFFIEQKPAKP